MKDDSITRALRTAKGRAKLAANLLLAHYLIHCCCYYELDATILTDTEFDGLAHDLAARWDEVDHPHKQLVNIDSLREATSGYYLKYPGIVQSCAKRLVEQGVART